MAERVDQLLRQNHRVSSTLDAVLSEISSRRALQGAVESGLVSVFSRLSGEVKPTRWNQVDQAFVQAMYLLDLCPTVADLLDRSGKHPDFDSEELTEPRMLSQALVGSILLREAVTGLRTTVTATLQHLDPDRGRVNRSDMDPVAEACRSYDSLLRIPSFRDALRYIDDLLKWAIHLTATSRVLKSLTSTVGFRGWVAVCGSGNEMDSPPTQIPQDVHLPPRKSPIDPFTICCGLL